MGIQQRRWWCGKRGVIGVLQRWRRFSDGIGNRRERLNAIQAALRICHGLQVPRSLARGKRITRRLHWWLLRRSEGIRNPPRVPRGCKGDTIGILECGDGPIIKPAAPQKGRQHPDATGHHHCRQCQLYGPCHRTTQKKHLAARPRDHCESVGWTGHHRWWPSAIPRHPSLGGNLRDSDNQSRCSAAARRAAAPPQLCLLFSVCEKMHLAACGTRLPPQDEAISEQKTPTFAAVKPTPAATLYRSY